MNLPAVVFFVVLAVATRVMWRRGARAVALGCGALTALFGLSVVRSTDTWLLIVFALVGAFVLWQNRIRTAATVTRWGATSRRKAGVASSTDIVKVGGTLAMRRRAPIVRPSLAIPGRRAWLTRMRRLPPIEVGVELCQVGALRVWSSIEDVVAAFGGPRVGKTQWLAGRVIDAPGAVLVTSTRTDLLDQTAPLRAERGPVYVFNPVGLGGRPTTITFDPLIGCADPITAAERATDMLSAAHHDRAGGDRQFWDDLARANLAALMHAAALGHGLSMHDVQAWLAEPQEFESVILSLLTESPERGLHNAVVQFLGTNERTRSSITTTISPALQWLMHKPAREAAWPVSEGGAAFDVATLLAQRASVYMLGGEEAQVAPLVCALTGYVAREARRLAAFCPGGRLDPPLSLRLDEAALICPVPLHQWSADMGGRGVSIVACFQSRAQLVDRYGDAKAATFLNNAGGKLLFGGTGDRDDLTYWSTLAGERDEPITTTDMNGRVASRTTRRVPVLAPAQLANLPAGKVVVFRRDMPPVIGRAEQAWRRRDVHAFQHPDATTVRFQAWLVLRWLALRAWLGRRVADPLAVAWRWVARQFAAVWALLARWVTALRYRLTGRGQVTGCRVYEPGLGRFHQGGDVADLPTTPLPVIPPGRRPRELRAGPGATSPTSPAPTARAQDGDQP